MHSLWTTNSGGKAFAVLQEIHTGYDVFIQQGFSSAGPVTSSLKLMNENVDWEVM